MNILPKHALLALAAAALLTATPNVAPAAELSVSQVSWLREDGTVFHPSSDTGEFTIQLEPSDMMAMTYIEEFEHWIGYLNVVVARPGGGGREWVVRNFPVIVDDSADLLGQLPTTLDAPLPCGSIETLSLVEVEFAIEPTPVSDPAYSPRSAVVEPVERLWGGMAADGFYRAGLSTTEGLEFLRIGSTRGPVDRPLVNDLFGFGPGDNPPAQFGKKEKVLIDEKDIQRVDEQPWHCTPGSMARSFRYLADSKTITLDTKIEDIERELAKDLKTGVVVKGTRPQDMVPGAQAFVARNKLPLEVTDTGDGRVAAAELGKGADVTMHFQLLVVRPVLINGRWQLRYVPAYGHSVFVTAMQPVLDRGKNLIGYKISTLDDGRQGKKDAKDRKRVYSLDLRDRSLFVYDGKGNRVETGFLDPNAKLIVKKKRD